MDNKIDDVTKNRVLNFFGSLADETRLKILITIANGPTNVNEIHRSVGKEKLTLSAVSHQLRLLKDLGVVSCEKQGKEKLYELSDNFCWCILRDTFKQFNNNIKIKCKKCENKRQLVKSKK